MQINKLSQNPMKNSITQYLSNTYSLNFTEVISIRRRKTKKPARLACFIFCMSLLSSACSAVNESNSTTAAAATLNERIQAVDSDVADMASDTYCEVASDCAFLAMGQRACGGQSSYKIYSKRIGEEAVSKLQALAVESNRLAKKANQKSGLLSTCEIYPLPSPSCVENQCVQNKSPQPTY